MSAKPANQRPDGVARAAFWFGSGTLSSRILGLIRDSLLFALMPLDMKDAWVAAFKLPNFFRRLLGEGGLSVSFIPLFVSLQTQGKEAEARALINGVFTLLMGLVLSVCLLGFFFMEPLVMSWLGGPGFTSVPGKIEMTIQMGRVMIFFLFVITLFAYFMALLNGLNRFALSGYAPLFLNAALIVALLLYRQSPQLAEASAWAVVIGGGLQALFLLPSVWQLGVLPRLTLHILTAPVLRVLRKFLPTVIGVGVLQVLNLINASFASQLMPGSISYIYLGDRILELPLSLIAVSIGTALLPSLSRDWSAGDREGFVASLGKNLRLFHFLVIPSIVGLWILGTDIVSVLFGRGEFKAEEVEIVASILRVYCLTLLCAGGLKILTQGFYAKGDTLTPAVVASLGLGLHLLMAPYWMQMYGVQGLVLSTSLTTLFNLGLSALWLQWKVALLPWSQMTLHSVRCLLAASGMGAFLLLIKEVSWRQNRLLFDLPLLFLIIGVASLIYFALAVLLRLEEMQMVRRRILKF